MVYCLLDSGVKIKFMFGDFDLSLSHWAYTVDSNRKNWGKLNVKIVMSSENWWKSKLLQEYLMQKLTGVIIASKLVFLSCVQWEWLPSWVPFSSFWISHPIISFFILCLQIKDFAAYLAVSSNTSGSTAKDLFTDVMDELEKQVK